MPFPGSRRLAETAKSVFRSKTITLPLNWRPPGPQYPQAFVSEARHVPIAPPRTLFRAASNNRDHVTAATAIGDRLAHFIDRIAVAISGAIEKWLKMSMLQGVRINGTVGIVAPGNLTAPSLAPLILVEAPDNTPMERRYANAIAGAIGTQWKRWSVGLTGILAYPTLAAVAAPIAPPTPNLPSPLAAMSSTGEASLCPSALKAEMHHLLGIGNAQHADALFDALARALSAAFQDFKRRTVVHNAMATGPVPTFAPPAVPSGPVVEGTIVPRPGVLL